MQFFEILIRLNNKEVPEEENKITELVNVFNDYSERTDIPHQKPTEYPA